MSRGQAHSSASWAISTPSTSTVTRRWLASTSSARAVAVPSATDAISLVCLARLRVSCPSSPMRTRRSSNRCATSCSSGRNCAHARSALLADLPVAVAFAQVLQHELYQSGFWTQADRFGWSEDRFAQLGGRHRLQDLLAIAQGSGQLAIAQAVTVEVGEKVRVCDGLP
ncbi:hypothetical protein HII36_22200 [Nonomuraea sp. NN258]|nr:hypothetical protein [Nonomuraea antri]NRQ34534.1 hypothetical protein [Nonomuraea antri]